MSIPDRHRLHEDAAAIAGNSWLFRTIERFFEVAILAWGTSGTRAGLVGIAGGPQASAPRLVRLGGAAALSATVVHVALIGLESLLAPPLSGLGWVAAVPPAILCIARPDVIVAAWDRSRWRRRSPRSLE